MTELLLALLLVAASSSTGTGVAVPPSLAPPAGTAVADSVPFGVTTTFMVGSLLLEQGNPAAALPYLEHAHRLAPGEGQIAEVYVAALVALERRQEAMAVLRERVAAVPAEPTPRRQLVALLTADRRFDEALAVLDDARRAGGDDAELLLLDAEVLARAGRLDESITRYREARNRLPERAEQITLLLAALYQEAGRPEERAALWAEGLTAWPESRPLRAGALRDLISDGKVREALALASRGDSLLARSPADSTEGFSWTVEVASLLAQAGQQDEAIRVLERRRRARLLDREGSLWLGRLLVHAERLDDALSVLREAVTRWPASSGARLHLGEALLARGDEAEGEAQLRQGVRLAPDDPEALVALLRLLTMRSGHAPSSDAAVDKAPRAELARLAARGRELVGPQDARGQMVIGYAYRSLREPAAAAVAFAAAATGPAVRREALLQLAICQEDLQRLDDARSSLETLHGEFPDDPTAANALGYFLAERGVELDRADSLVRAALAKQPENPYYLDSLGWIAYRRGQYQSAFDVLVRASNGAPEQAEILEHLGRTLRALNRPEEAARVLRRALEVGADPQRVNRLLREWGESRATP